MGNRRPSARTGTAGAWPAYKAGLNAAIIAKVASRTILRCSSGIDDNLKPGRHGGVTAFYELPSDGSVTTG
jgi:hypothetical protein